jgi:uncharacterized protein YbjT (DUF2867 family)
MIVVTTPTGQIGSKVLEHLLAAEQKVRVIVRDPARLTPDAAERAEVTVGSHADPDVVEEAFAGADAVFWLRPPSPGGANAVEGYRDFTRAAAGGVVRHGVGRVVAVTSMGRSYGGPSGLLDAAFAIDDMFEETGVPYRAVRPGGLMENLLRDLDTIRGEATFSMPHPADLPVALSATRDVAAAAADLLLDPTWTGTGSAPVVSPDDLTPAGMAQVMSEVLGREIRYREVPLASVTEGMRSFGWPDGWLADYAAMVEAQRDGAYDPATVLARSATTFRQWCTDVLGPALR